MKNQPIKDTPHSQVQTHLSMQEAAEHDSEPQQREVHIIDYWVQSEEAAPSF